MVHEVTNNYGSGVFNTEDDAIMALQMLGMYHKMNIQPSEVKEQLNKNGSYEKYPLVIRRCGI